MDDQRVMTMGDWLITLLISNIPCVGIIMLFVWAFGTGNENRKNYARAYLIFVLILFIVGIVISVIFGSVLSAILGGYYY